MAIRQAARGALLRRVRFAGQQGFVDEQGVRLEHRSVRVHQVTGGEGDHVTANDLLSEDLAGVAVPDDAGAQAGVAPQSVGCPAGPVLLHEVERYAEQHDHDDYRCARQIARRAAERRRHEQHDDQRVREPPEDLERDPAPRRALQHVAAFGAEPLRRLRLREP